VRDKGPGAEPEGNAEDEGGCQPKDPRREGGEGDFDDV